VNLRSLRSFDDGKEDDVHRFRPLLLLAILCSACETVPEPPLVRELPHLESTSPELRAEIDRLVDVLVDFHSGIDGIDAQTRLVEIGRPALPRVISAFLKTGPWGERVAMVNACVVDATLREMAPEMLAPKSPPLKPMSMPSEAQIRKTVESWYRWWASESDNAVT
jgi:hypothetical protein